MEVDTFGHFCLKAKTNLIRGSTEPSWNEVCFMLMLGINLNFHWKMVINVLKLAYTQIIETNISSYNPHVGPIWILLHALIYKAQVHCNCNCSLTAVHLFLCRNMVVLWSHISFFICTVYNIFHETAPQNFDIELDGAQQLRVLVYKMSAGEETLIGKCALEVSVETLWFCLVDINIKVNELSNLRSKMW